jgi:dihydroorotase
VKRHPFAEAADGAIGLETLLAASLRLYHNGEVGLLPLLRAMTINPAKLLGLPSGRLEKGAPADLILVDLGQPWVVDRTLLKARSKNSPFDESRMQGRVLTTMVAGKTVYQYAAGERA